MWKSMLKRWIKSSTPVARRNVMRVETLDDRIVPAVITFQQGFVPVDGTQVPIPNAPIYSGTQDAQIDSKLTTTPDGADTEVSVDQSNTGGIQTQFLVQFADIFGPAAGRIPVGSKIESAKLEVFVTSSTNLTSFVSFSRMLTPWSQSTATWDFFSSTAGGLQPDDVEMSSVIDDILKDSQLGGDIVADFDLTDSVQAWATGVPNFGWGVTQSGGNGWDIATSENEDLASRPKLTVTFTEPTGAGEFIFSQPTYTASEGNTGSKTVSIDIYRTGGDNGIAKVNVALASTPGTATLGTDFTFTPSQITFEGGQRVSNFKFDIISDVAIEGPETINFVLQNPTAGTVSATKGAATFTIGDNDALINEVFFDVVGADASFPGFEFVELIGTPGASLGNINGSNLYFVGVESDNVGAADFGNADLVVDLSTASFGSSGLLVLRPTIFNYWTTAPAGVNEVIFGNPDSKDILENPSVGYLLVLSPTPITVDTDLDLNNDGTIDNLPAGALVLDQIGTTDGGGSDRVVGTGGAGIRLTQANGNMDAVSRFNSLTTNDLIPNYVGAWYGGDVLSNASPAYAIPTDPTNFGKATPNTPPGALVTPGALNIPRAIAFVPSNVQVNESAGQVTVTVVRLGDTSTKATVDYATVNGSALAGQDYVAQSGTIEFDVGQTSEDVIITLINPMDPEGFERFTVELSNPSAPFQISNKTVSVLIEDDDSIVATFQDGVNGYFGTQDVGLFSWGPNDTFGSDIAFSVDQSDQDLPTQGLVRFNDVFGSGLGQVPQSATIHGGVLTFFVTSSSDFNARIRFYEMLQDWNEDSATWANVNSTITNGVTPDDVEARSVPDFQVPNPSATDLIDMIIPAETLQAWANGASNFGWMLNSDSGDGWDFLTREVTNPLLRPKLSVIYTEPEGKGDFRFERSEYSVSEGATTATFNISRVGGSTDSATVKYSLSGITATAASDFTASSGQVTFPQGVLSIPITVSILEDNFREANETFQLVLSDPSPGSTILASGSSAIVTIRDNEAPTNILLNELNINPPGTDQPFEYIELFGTANEGLGNLYLVTLEGDGGGNLTTLGKNVFRGYADFAIDLSKFSNGTSGYTVAAADAGGFAIPSGTTAVSSPFLSNGSEVSLQNGTNSFLLVYNPDATITTDGFDFDWNNDGILDLPTGSIIIDAISTTQGLLGDLVYPNATSTVVVPSGAVPDSLSRIVGNTVASDGNGWFGGDLLGVLSDTRYYDASKSTANLPAGAVITPGAVNYTVNTVPVITSNGAGATASLLVNSGSTAVTTVTSVDPDIGQPRTFSLSGPDAALFTISQVDGALTFGSAPDFAVPLDANTDNIYEVTVTVSDGTASDIQALSVKVIPNVTSFVVNNGNAQRSRITTVEVIFAGSVSPADFTTLNTIQFQRTGVSSIATGAIGDIVASGPASNNHVGVAPGTASSLILTFDNNGMTLNSNTSGVESGSLSDGYWRLFVNGTAVSNLNDVALRRLYGDVTTFVPPTGTVDGSDLTEFGNAFGTINIALDFNNDNTVDGNDLTVFGNRFGNVL
jgi:hypothetical protein